MFDNDDARDLQKHAARESLIHQYRVTFGLTRKCALEDFAAHVENDEENPIVLQRPLVRRPRTRRRQEAHA